MKFSKPFRSSQIVSEDKYLGKEQKEAKGTSLKCLLNFETTKEQLILVKTGISGVSAEGARNNLDGEIPDWDFDKVRRNAHAAWSKNLSRIKITTEQCAAKADFLHSDVSLDGGADFVR